MSVSGFNRSLTYQQNTTLLLLLGWVAYIITSPIYIFKSGLPQPSDFIIAATSAFGILIFFMQKPVVFNRVFTLLCLMIGLFFSVNIAYAIFLQDMKFLLACTYYIFNGMVFTNTVLLFKAIPDKMIYWGRIATLASLFIQFIWIRYGFSGMDGRETGSFNNPNQLGYWALLSACTLLLLNYGKRMKIIDIIGFIACAYFVTESLSRAVILSYGLLFIAFLIGNYVSTLSKIILAAIVILYSLVQIVIFENPQFLFNKFNVLETVLERVETVQDEGGGTIIEERGYDRIINHPEYLLWGSGEGSYWRFSELGVRGLELHSGIGTILFSYGIFGFALFCAFIFTIFKQSPLIFWITLASVMAYGITHQHVRTTGFWLYLAFAYAMVRYVIQPRATASSHPYR